MDKKKSLKKIKSFEKLKKEHLEKIENYKGKDYTLIPYWEKQIERFDREIQEEKDELKNN
jgi:hypothetical protein